MRSRQQFREALVAAFTDDELSILLNDLGVDPDVIAGRTLGQETYADNLITYFEKRGRIDALLSALRAIRPAVQWNYQPQHLAAAFATAPTPLVIAGAFAIAAVVVIALVLRMPGAGSRTNATPVAMSGGYNILVTDFAEVDASETHTSPEGLRLGRHFAGALKQELTDGLAPDARADLSGAVWDASDARANGWLAITVTTDAQAEALAKQTSADLVVYGRIEQAGAAPSDKQLVLGFHQARRNGVHEEIAGAYALGAPMPLALPMTTDMDSAARLELNARQRLLLRLALGSLYDRLGRSEQALSVFVNMASLPGGDKGPIGAAIAYLSGRESLLLKRSEQAQRYHEQALMLDATFVRAHLGLGDVYYQRVAQMPAEQRLGSDALAKASDHYSTAETLALTRKDSERLATIARLGRGLVSLARADAHSLSDAIEESGREAREAISLIEPSILVLKGDRGADPRTLASAYLALGNASMLAALAAVGENAEAVRGQRARAKASYEACVELDVRSDPLLAADLAALCKQNLERIATLLPE